MLRDLRLVTIAETFSRVVSFVTVPLLTRALMPADYGLYKSTLLLFSVLLMTRGLLSPGLILEKRLPEISQWRQRQLVAASALALGCVLMLTVLALWLAVELSLVTLLSPSLQRFVEGHFLLVCVTLLSTPLYRFGQTALRGMDEFTYFSALTVGREAVFLVAVVGLFLTGTLTVVTVVMFLLLANSAAIIGEITLLRRWFIAIPDFAALATQIRTISIPLAPRILFKKARDIVPDAVVLSVFGAGIFGQWSLLFIFVSAFSLVTRPLSKILLPKLSGRLSRDEPIEGIVHRYYRLLGILIVPAIVGGWLLGPVLIQEVFGEKYYYGLAVTAVLITSFGIQSFNTLSGRFFIATNRSIYETYTQVFSAGILLSVAAVGAYLANSLVVVGFAFLLEQTAILAFSLWYQSQYVSTPSLSIKEVTKMMTALAALGSIVWLTRPLISDTFLAVGVVLLGAFVYFATLYVTGFFTDDDLDLFNRFITV